MKSNLEIFFSYAWRLCNGPKLIEEYVFYPKRKWRVDFYHEATKTAIEIEGGVATGRHTSFKGFINDCDKYNAMTEMGISLFRLTRFHFLEGKRIKIEHISKIINYISEKSKK